MSSDEAVGESFKEGKEGEKHDDDSFEDHPPTTAPTTTATTTPVVGTTPDAKSVATSKSAKSATSAGSTVMTEEMKALKRKERLEQNRLSARESRKRKKTMIEELQRTVITLSRENKELNQRNDALRRQLIEIGTKFPNAVPLHAILGTNMNFDQQQQQQAAAAAAGQQVPQQQPQQNPTQSPTQQTTAAPPPAALPATNTAPAATASQPAPPMFTGGARFPQGMTVAGATGSPLFAPNAASRSNLPPPVQPQPPQPPMPAPGAWEGQATAAPFGAPPAAASK